MQGLIKYLILISLLYFSVSGAAQNHNFLKNFFTVEDGLSNNEVTAIVQDNDGFIWIGTRGGLNRYDGYEFKIFNQVPGDSNSLVNPSVESLFVDSKGNIWIGTKSGGVSKYNPVTGVFTNFASNYKHTNRILPDNRILCFHEDRKGKIWMGTWENGVIVYDPEKNVSKHYLSNSLVLSFVKTDDGKLWIGTGGDDNKLCQYDEKGDTLIKFNSGGPCNDLIYDEKRNAIWIAGGAEGLRRFDLRNYRLDNYGIEAFLPKNSRSAHVYESVFLDRQDNIWLGTWGTGFFNFLPESETFGRYLIYPETRQTTNKDYDTVLDIFQDKDDNIWLGTNGGGICVLTPKLNFNSVGYHPEPNKGLPNTRIMSVLEDHGSNFWLGTIGDGLFWSPDRENFYQVENNYISESRFCIIKYLYEDESGAVWVGTNDGTFIVQFTDGKPAMLPTSKFHQTIAFNRTAVSFLDTEELFFSGTLESGLYILNKKNNYKLGKWLHMRALNSGNIYSDRISYMLKDSNERIWLGTYNGLHIFNKKDTTVHLVEDYFRIDGEFTGNIITSLDEDEKGNIWIGTPNGLNKLTETDNNQFRVEYFTEEDGLASNFIKGISHDLNGNIWVSTNVGISKLITKDNNRVVNFDELDGVKGKNFTEASVYKNQKGEIFFGGTHGVTWFNPDEIEEYSVALKPVFTGLKVLNKVIKPDQSQNSKSILFNSLTHTKEIELSYRQNYFEIEFSALDYKSMGRNQFKYKLENHDEGWHNIGNRRFVIFNNLRPGDYKLLVKSSNSHNFWNEDPAELIIKIHPPFWQTWYALVFYILVVVGIVTIIRWNAVKQVRLANSLEVEKLQHQQDQKINELKLRFFTNLSHEFRTPLTLILAPLKELLGKKEQYRISGEAQNKINIIQNNSLRLMKMVNQLLDFRKVESGNMKLHASKTNLEEFVAEVCHPFFELAQINNINFKYTPSLKTKDSWIDRNKIEIILNNLISNSFKYIRGNGKIEVTLYEEEDVVLLNVSDNGPGIPPTEIKNIFDRFYRIEKGQGDGSSGIGLALTKRLVELHHGTISVASEPDKHTEFTVSLPKGSEHLSQGEMVEVDKQEKKYSGSEQIFESVFADKPKLLAKSEECILIIEDNAEVKDYLVSILEPLYCIDTATDGEEGYEKATSKPYDLIISDVMMPKVDGFELCKKIKANESTSTVPFIFLTAKSDEQFRLMGTQLGADDFISKPFDPNLLLQKVKNILESRKKLQKQYSKSIRLEPSDIEITSSDEIFIEKAISIIEDNLQNHNFSSDVLAAEMNMSSSTFYRRLKGLTGSSTAEFIRSIRVKRAAQLLADKQRTITEIAYEVGFNDVKHFRTVFQKQFSCSPSEYREKL
ncbi:MAG: two-component regulator propeller domain-containing protein [Bacteroidota bacterium]